jgi:hypothetical protein
VNREVARKVADAVLFEGHMLYPYRPSAIKNRQRWTFGILFPAAYPEVNSGTERRAMHSEFLLEAEGDTRLQIELRFLHLLARQISKAIDHSSTVYRFEPVPSLLMDDHLIESWDEAVERSVVFDLSLHATSGQQLEFNFSGSSDIELLHNNSGRLVGKITRTQHELKGSITVESAELREGVLKVSIDVVNSSAVDAASAYEPLDRNAALLRSLLSAHTVVTASAANFVSLLEPPEALRDAVAACKNVGNFPVLVGQQPERDMLLCSPIVLYDYPQIAPESSNDFFDATEMDEMLTLRIMTLTDEEKSEMRFSDEHARKLLERTEQNARAQLMRTHGVIRSMRPVSEKP